MNWQEILVLLLFLLATLFVGRMLVNQFRTKNTSCGKQCKCGVDFNVLDKEMQK